MMMNNDYPQPSGNIEARDPVPFPEPELGRCTRDVIIRYIVRDERLQAVLTRAPSSGIESDSDMDDEDDDDTKYLVILDGGEKALWLHEVLRDAIYGKVWSTYVVRRRQQQTASYMDIWDVTGERCAVKEMLWFLIEKKFRHTEDPVKEVSAMQYLRRWHNGNNTAMQESLDTNVVMLRNALTDDIFLYVVTPYFEGGELFYSLYGEDTRFNEDEARYYMDSILNGIETLQRAGICHRDLSIENIMIHRGHCVIIDMGQCIRIPYAERQQQHRLLIHPQGPSGKWRMRSPEIERELSGNAEPFDGHAVDMWAVGTILFTMVVGFVALEDPKKERRFVEMASHLMRNGRINGVTHFLNAHRNIHFSPELVTLLQDMFWLDPRQRLSLGQVRAHPWMNGPRQMP
mmetsp:Transcript_17235/g.24514  ORF Transcript_17235/g.24514 Transcript_17235/m.24514 type:complete len:402 (+) Transcript_17235:303-1508(+)